MQVLLNQFFFARRHTQSLYLLSLLFVLLLPLTMHLRLWGWSAAGTISSLASAALALLLLYRRSPLLLLPCLAIWSILQSVNVELVVAVGRMPSAADVVYLVDPTMIRNSLEGGGLARPGYLTALLLGSAVTVTMCLLARPLAPAGLLRMLCWVFILLSPFHIVARQWDLAAEPWKQFSIFHKLAAETVAKLWQADDKNEARVTAWANLHQEALTRLDLQGRRLIGQGKAQNVLLVVLEGVSGAYIDQIREAQGYQWDEHPMPRLSALAREYGAMHTADFVVHNHQTIRGLYALLCGDYPKLDVSTPKATELLAQGGQEHVCLPSQLASHGFDTTFLQAADLAFMSKDKAMPRMGFQKTEGRESITGPPEQKIAWGWDDKAFFAGSLRSIKKLRQQKQPWLLTLLTVGTHQPYGAPPLYMERYHNSEKMAAMAYLDDTVSQFLTNLHGLGVMNDTLVIVTSDESHGTDDLRLSNAWGLCLVFAPEREQLPPFKQGVYAHIDMSASILDYFNLPIDRGTGGRSLFRDYDSGREMISYTNGILRHLNSAGNLIECDFQQICREYNHGHRFMLPQATELRRFSGTVAHQETALAQVLNHSLALPDEQDYLFADGDRRRLKPKIENDWTDNLIGAQYLDFAQGTRTTVSLRIKAVKTDGKGATLRLALKEYDRDSTVSPPLLPLLHKGEEVAITFDIDNPKGRRAFSFHLLGEGRGEIEISEFRVNTHRLSAVPVTPRPVGPTVQATSKDG